MIGTLLLRGTVVLGALSALTGCTLFAGSDPGQGVPSDQPSPDGIQLPAFPLPTSDWRQGDGADLALLNATLHRDGKCLVAVAATGPPNPTAIVWPKGFTAFVFDKGVVSVRNADGTVVARSGQEISAGGGFGPTDIGPWKNMPCVSEYDEVFVVQDALTGDKP